MNKHKKKYRDKEYRIIKNCLIILKVIHDGKQVRVVDLAEMFKVSHRTIYRYLNILREVGYEIEYNKEIKSYEIVNIENVDLGYII